MDQYLYSAVFYKDDFDDQVAYSALIPDLGISVDGDNYEETYLLIKNYLKAYLDIALREDYEFNLPSPIEKIMKKYASGLVMLVDAIVEPKQK